MLSRKSVRRCAQLFTARLWVKMEFRRSYASEKLLLTHPFKLNLLATLRVRNGDVMVFLTACNISHLFLFFLSQEKQKSYQECFSTRAAKAGTRNGTGKRARGS